MVADEEEDDVIRELEYDAILEACADFPVIPFPVLESESFGQRRLPIEIAHERVNGFMDKDYYSNPSTFRSGGHP